MKTVTLEGVRRTTAFFALSLALLCLPAACDHDGTPCFPGDFIACSCDDGAAGYAQCDGQGGAYGACDCSGAALGPAPAMPACVDNVTVPDKLCLLSSCESDEQCASGLCYSFNMKGLMCSQACTTNLDCPAPSPGCNMMGICKAS